MIVINADAISLMMMAVVVVVVIILRNEISEVLLATAKATIAGRIVIITSSNTIGNASIANNTGNCNVIAASPAQSRLTEIVRDCAGCLSPCRLGCMQNASLQKCWHPKP